MIWLVAQMWALLLGAFLIGLAAGGFAFMRLDRNGGARPAAGSAIDAAGAVQAAEPAILFDRPDGDPDDLTQIIGIDVATARRLNAIGVFHFRQIAGWDEASARWIELRLNEPGRVTRERWAEQAASIA